MAVFCNTNICKTVLVLESEHTASSRNSQEVATCSDTPHSSLLGRSYNLENEELEIKTECVSESSDAECQEYKLYLTGQEQQVLIQICFTSVPFVYFEFNIWDLLFEFYLLHIFLTT